MAELFQGIIALAVIIGGGLIIVMRPEQSTYVVPFMALVLGFYFGAKTSTPFPTTTPQAPQLPQIPQLPQLPQPAATPQPPPPSGDPTKG
jgi:hypothetical protein